MTADATNAVALGSGSVADAANTISVGASDNLRRITNVGDATGDTDAINLRQLQAALDGVGGGGGVTEARVHEIAGAGDATTLTAANDYTDAQIAGLDLVSETRVQEIADTGDAATLAEANGYTDVRETAIRADMQDGDEATLASANEYTDASSSSTLSSANTYTDNAIQALVGFDAGGLNDRVTMLEDRFDDFDRRLHRQDRRIDRMGAMSSAMLNMAINAAGTQSPRGRIAVGAGFQGGEQGLSIGYGKRIGRTASFSIGGAFSSGEASAGIGFGVDL